jgi:hypothetical protein
MESFAGKVDPRRDCRPAFFICGLLSNYFHVDWHGLSYVRHSSLVWFRSRLIFGCFANLYGAIQQSLAADGAVTCFLSSLFPFSSNADRAPQLKASVGLLREGYK